MPLGEEVPILIPISIALAFVVFSMGALFLNYSEQKAAVYMELEADSILKNAIYKVFYNGDSGYLNYSLINEFEGASCSPLSLINLSSYYGCRVEIKDISTGKNLCFENGPLEENLVLRKSVSVAIARGDFSDAGEVTIFVSK